MPTPIPAFAAWLEAETEPPPQLGPPNPDASGPLAPLYQVFDGQLDGPPLIESHRILSFANAQDEKRRMDALAQEEGWDSDWWNPVWHPFASDGAGQLLVVDAASGRVLEFLHDDAPRPVIAPDLETLFERLWTALDDGTYIYHPVFGLGTPEEASAYMAARARFTPPPPRAEPRPTAALWLIMLPSATFFAIGAGFELGAAFTAIGTTAIALIMTAVGWKLGWVVLD